VRDELFNRRKRMLFLLAARNKPSIVFKAVADEFKCSVAAVRRDYYSMKEWIHDFEQEVHLTAIALEGMDFAVREAVNLLVGIKPIRADGQLTMKQIFAKVGALTVYVRAVSEDIKFKQSIGLINRKPEEIVTYDSAGEMPFEVDPLVKEALIAAREAHKLQKELLDKKRAKDAAESSQATDAPEG
jgi:hypothetical protein